LDDSLGGLRGSTIHEYSHCGQKYLGGPKDRTLILIVLDDWHSGQDGVSPVESEIDATAMLVLEMNQPIYKEGVDTREGVGCPKTHLPAGWILRGPCRTLNRTNVPFTPL
jgi:hypothetical protein